MAVAREDRATDRLSASLAGLEAGMIAALWMLVWMGLSAVWRRSSFWTAENLFATTFYGGSAIHSGFAASTLSGVALYLLVYSSLGCLFASLVRVPPSGLRLVLLSILVALGWYYLSFHLIWKRLSPLVTLLYAEEPTMLGHVIYGTVLARFPKYLPKAAPTFPLELPAPAEVAESAAGPSDISAPLP